jgi:hypothetical protein
MANDLQYFNPQHWSRRLQLYLKNTLVAREITSFEEQAVLTDGTRVSRPYGTDFFVDNYTKYQDAGSQAIGSVDEFLEINQTKVISFDLDAIDKIQNKYDTENYYIEKAQYRLKNEIDGNLLKEVHQFKQFADDGTAGGTPGNPITLSASNAARFFTNSGALLHTAGCEMDKTWAAVVSPMTAAVITQTMIGSGFNMADSALRNGYAGDFAGYKIYVDQNVNHSNTISLTNNTLATTNVTIAGVTFNFVTPIGSVAGNVLIGADTTATAANLAAAINGGAGADTTYVEVSAANRAKLRRLGIVATSALGVVTIRTYGKTTYAKAGTNAANVTLGTQVEHAILCRPGAIDMVMQKNIEVQKNKIQSKTGYTMLIWALYGIKTFEEGKDRGLDMRIAAL